MQWSATRCNDTAKRIELSTKKALDVGGEGRSQLFFAKKSLILKPSYIRPSILNMNSLKNNNKMETKVVSFEQMPELIQNLVERLEALEKTVRDGTVSSADSRQY